MEVKDTAHQRFNSALTFGLCFLMLALTTTLVASGCASLKQPTTATGRKANYVASHHELSPELAGSIEAGRLVLGMNREQVEAVIGEPNRQTSFQTRDAEVWLYRAGRVHVNQLPDGIEAFRLVFIKDRLVLVEPF